MARFVKRGKVWQYEISYKDENGQYKKIRKSGFAKKGEAIAEAGEIENNLYRGGKVGNLDILLSEHFEEWMNVFKKGSVSDVTFLKYKAMLKAIRNYFPTDTLKNLNRATYQKRINHFAQTHATATVSLLHSYIHASIQHLIYERVLLYDFTAGILAVGKKEGSKKEDKFLDYANFEALMNLAKQKMSLADPSFFMIFIAGMTGMRTGELYGLTWENVDLEKGIIRVVRSFDYNTTKDFISTKNEQSKRFIELDKNTLKCMRKFKKEQEKLNINNPNEHVFIGEKNCLLSRVTVSNRLKSLLKSLNIQTNLSIHGLRHTHASVLIYKGVNIVAISRHLGHKNVNVTLSTYTHVLKELEESENEKIKTIFSEI